MNGQRVSRRGFMRRVAAATAGLAGGPLISAAGAAGAGSAGGGKQMNVLLIAVDDLRPELGCYGAKHMVTPNLDKFAASGRLFRRQYVAMPTCGASRCALLTGQRPRSSARMHNGAFQSLSQMRTDTPQTLPEALYSRQPLPAR